MSLPLRKFILTDIIPSTGGQIPKGQMGTKFRRSWVVDVVTRHTFTGGPSGGAIRLR